MSDALFKEFSSISSKQWKQNIQFDLMGEDYNQTLVSKTPEGIAIKPFYHKDEFNQLQIKNFPSSFDICQSIFVNDERKANFLAIDALKRGANAIKFTAVKRFDIKVLFQGLIGDSTNSSIKFYLEFMFLDLDFILKLMNHLNTQSCFLNVDIIGNLSKNGNWFFNHREDHRILTQLLNNNKINGAVIGINAGHYQNSGADMVQQIAYTLAHANEYLNHFGENMGSLINVNFSVGGHYFTEIAKIRAFRYLWNLLIEDYKYDIKATIFVEPSLRNKSFYDYNSNMIRTTSECMAAILGGADTINNLSYDAIFRKKNEFGERIARNQLVIMKEESQLKNAKFVEGSYFIEQLTHEIAERALALFKNIEKGGGFVKQLFDGKIQRKIVESANKEQQLFDEEKSILIGVNKNITPGKMKQQIELYPFLKLRSDEMIVQPILAKRLAEKIEKDRLAQESD